MRNPHKLISLFCALLLLSTPTTAFADTDNGEPELYDFSLSRQVVSPGSTLSIGANGWDEDGIRSILLRFEEEHSKTILTVTLKTSAEGAEKECLCNGELSVPATAPEGVYRLKSASLTDKSGNRSLYRREEDIRDDDEEEALEEIPSFQVVKNPGTLSPLACQVERKDLSAGCTTALSLTLPQAPMGFDKATAVFWNPQNGRRLIYNIKEEDEVAAGVYRAELEIPEHEPQGSYTLLKITVKDRTGESVTYASNGEEDSFPLPVTCSFQVGNSQGDTTPPVLHSVAITGTRTIGNNREYQLEVRASDDLSGVEHITMRFHNDQNDRSVTKVLTKDDRWSGVYTGWLQVSLFEPDGTFYLDNVGLMDEAKNYQAYCRPADIKDWNHKLPLPQNISFTLGKGITQADETGPQLVSVGLSCEKLDAGDELTVTAKAKDDLSGVDSIRLQFKNAEGKSINVTLKEKAKGYEGKVKSFQTKQEGTYRLTRATLTDKAGNRQVYTVSPLGTQLPLPLTASFTIDD